MYVLQLAKLSGAKMILTSVGPVTNYGWHKRTLE
jgi:hypothetical protein